MLKVLLVLLGAAIGFGVGVWAARYILERPVVYVDRVIESVAKPIALAFNDAERCKSEIEKNASLANVCAQKLGVLTQNLEAAKQSAERNRNYALELQKQQENVRADLLEEFKDYEAWAQTPLPKTLELERVYEDCTSTSAASADERVAVCVRAVSDDTCRSDTYDSSASCSNSSDSSSSSVQSSNE